jgi:CHAD domain-containing protein
MDTYPFAVSQATRLLERLAFQMNGAVHSPQPDSIHDLRVAVRRFTQVLAACKDCFPAKPARKMRKRLKVIMHLAGEVRDLDIALEFMTASDADGLEPKLRARRKAASKILVATLKHWTARKSVSKWRSALGSEVPAQKLRQLKAENLAHLELPRLAGRFFKEGIRAADPKASAEQRHHFRIAAKKFRYTLELFAEFYGPAAAGWIKQVKEMQTVLGAINDCRTVLELLASMGGDSKLEARLKKRQQRKSLEFRRAWEKNFGAAEEAKQWIAELGHTPRKPIARSATSQRQKDVALQA